jgi:hypothetical protein
MLIHKISASSYKEYYECPHKYFIDQQLGWQFPFGIAANKGTIAHAVLENLAKLKLAHQNNELKIQTKELGEIDVDLNINIVDLTDKLYHWYIKNQFPTEKWTDKVYKEVHNFVKVATTHNDGQFNPLNRHIINTERYVSYKLEYDWAILPDGKYIEIRGFIDLECSIDDTTIEIIDWKTGSWAYQNYSLADFQKDIQLNLYYYVLNKLYGDQYNYLVTIFLLNEGRPITVPLGKSDMSATEDRLQSTINKIRKDILPARNISHMCKRMCSYGKNTFEGSHIKPQDQFLRGGVAKIGEKMTICDQCNFELVRHGLDWTINNMKKPRDDK